MVYNLIQTIKDALKAEPFCNTVTEGDIFEVDLNKRTIFPLTHIMVNSSTHQGNVISFNVTMLCMDVINQKEKDNKVDIWNTQHLLATRVLDLLNRGDLRDGTYELSGNPTYDPFTERFENDLAGWAVTFDIVVKNDMTICN